MRYKIVFWTNIGLVIVTYQFIFNISVTLEIEIYYVRITGSEAVLLEREVSRRNHGFRVSFQKLIFSIKRYGMLNFPRIAFKLDN